MIFPNASGGTCGRQERQHHGHVNKPEQEQRLPPTKRAHHDFEDLRDGGFQRAGLGQRLFHLRQDLQAPPLRLRQRALERLNGQALRLDVQLEGGDARFVPGHLHTYG